ncbi:transposase family protein [Streptomyces sp. NPDC058382]|uniref:transposase family protein n=1 Tax=unclassified Streptomyces TaxID=2593676 RepID=UPI00362DD805
MLACVSSPIPAALDQHRDHPEARDGEFASLLEWLAEVPDPRDPRGVRHRLTVVLVLDACAVLSGATSLLAVGEWIADARRSYGPLASLYPAWRTSRITPVEALHR